jgi:chemotaxis protein methyltransferase CheR
MDDSKGVANCEVWMDSKIFEYFQKLIYDETGIVYNEKNAFALESRLEKVAKKLEFDSVQALFEACKTNIANDVKSFILDIATNNETSFFRDMHVFKSIEESLILPAIASGKKHFEFWSAACSAGQEVYSLAFMMEEIKTKAPHITYRITGSDISTEILARAKKGEYSQLEVQRGLPTTYLVKHLVKDESARPGEPSFWHVNQLIQKNIQFRHLNLLKPFPLMGPFDVVMLRNVLIYHDQEHRSDILSRIHKLLTAEGRLVLGSAERVIGLDHLYEINVENRAVTYRVQKKIAA